MHYTYHGNCSQPAVLLLDLPTHFVHLVEVTFYTPGTISTLINTVGAGHERLSKPRISRSLHFICWSLDTSCPYNRFIVTYSNN